MQVRGRGQMAPGPVGSLQLLIRGEIVVEQAGGGVVATVFWRLTIREWGW
jgi:hypothetical protein